MKQCSRNDCERRAIARGLCPTHYDWQKNHGGGFPPKPSAAERFWSRIRVVPSGCWEWQAAITQNGYGLCWFEKRLQYAHRVALKLVGAPVAPKGMDTDHLCRVRHCVNPDHLEVVTRRVNCLRGARWNKVLEGSVDAGD